MSNADKLGLPSHIPFVSWMVESRLHAFLGSAFLTLAMLYAIALVFEKRLAPIWRNVFFSFVVGDLFLGMSLANGAFLATTLKAETGRWYQSVFYDFVCLALGICVFLGGHFVVDGDNYEKKQLRSPSKLYHDVVLFIGYAWLLFRVELPALIYGTGSSRKVVMILPLIIFFAILVGVEKTHSKEEMEILRERAHPKRGWHFILAPGQFINDNRP